ncbi:MAG: family 1 extracellular solute-binding protein [Paenibacillaceae bacterium]|nr:family 1 extracellular solute-binding protein [Paenibacillaceae bacterium]
MHRLWVTKLITVCLVALLAGCVNEGASPAANQAADAGAANAPNPTAAVSNEPVTITMLQYLSKISDNEFEELIAKPVRAKYPNITMKIVNYKPDQTLSDLIAAGDFPDMIFAGTLDVNDFLNYKVLEDLNPMIKASKMDLKQFDPVGLEMVQSYDTSGKMFAMPYSLGFSALFYNKDLFDKFAVPYPKDDLTWDQATELAKKLTRQDGGTPYAGLGMMAANRFAIANFQSSFDVKTGKAVFTTDEWKKSMQIFLDITGIPGNDIKSTARNAFLKGTVAMRADLNPLMDQLGDLTRSGKPMNWDFAAFPTPSWRPGVVDTPLQILMMSNLSKHKQEVFNIMQLLSNKDVQTRMSQEGRLSALADPALQKVFGQNLDYLNGKNVGSLFKNKHKPQPMKSIYDEILVDQLNGAIDKISSGQADINTALREAEELANKDIAAQQH